MATKPNKSTQATEGAAVAQGDDANAHAAANTPPAPVAAKKKEVVQTPVKMKDGRVVDFPGETKALKSFAFDPNTGAVTGRIDFFSGDTVAVNYTDSALLGMAAAHGIGQKLGDSYAAIKDPAEAYQTCATLAERLAKDGAAGWGRQPGSGGGSGGSLGLLVAACMEATGAAAEQVRAYLDSLSNEVKVAMRDKDPTIAPIYQRLKAARDAAKPQPAVDLTAASAGLMALVKKAD